MELQHLRYFCEIVEQGSITRAAENLYLSQPSLSRMLKLIEDELGVALFERTGKGMQLTKDGAYFHQEVKNAIGILDHAKEKITGASSNGIQELTVAIMIASVPLSNALRLFRELFPEIKYHFFRPENPLGLNFNNYDVCISATPINFEGLQYETLYKEELVLLLPSGHPLSGLAYIDLKDLREESFILPSAGSITRLICDSLCNYAGFIPIVGATTNNMVSVKSYLKMGVGIAIIPLSGIESGLPQDISLSHIREPMPFRDICIARAKDRPATDASDAFFTFILDYFKRNAL